MAAIEAAKVQVTSKEAILAAIEAEISDLTVQAEATRPNGRLLAFEALEPNELENFCQSDKFGITVWPDDAPMPEPEEEQGGASVLDGIEYTDPLHVELLRELRYVKARRAAPRLNA
jgi:hypothetical protein